MRASHTRIISLSLTCALAFATLPGCRADGPPLPPAESMSIDISAFNNSAKSDAPGLQTHFNAAALRVGLLNTWVVVALAVPRLVFAAALSTEPTFEDNKWVWSFDATQAGKPLNATLTGAFDTKNDTGTTLELAMNVTCGHCKVPTDNFRWYTGTFLTGERKGHWQFFNPEITTADQTFVRIDWEVTDERHRTLTFTNGRTDGHEDAGDIIKYERAGDKLSVNVHDASKKLDFAAEIDTATGAGWLQVPDFNKGEKGCWGADRKNVACE